jgi:hypothetical protein
MNDLVSTTLLNTMALPFAVALGIALAARWAGYVRAGLAIGLGILLGGLAGQIAVAELPALPPRGSVDKLPWLGLGGLVLGVALQRVDSDRVRRHAIAGGLALAIVWIGWPRFVIPQTEAWLGGLILWGLVLWSLGRLQAAEAGGGVVVTVLLVGATAGIGLYSSSYSMAQLIAVLAAALVGAMVAGVRGGAGGFGPVAQLAIAGPFTGLLAMLAFYTQADPVALLLLAAIPLAASFAEPVQRAVLAGPIAEARPAARLAVLGALALVPAVIAVAVAVSRSGPLYY